MGKMPYAKPWALVAMVVCNGIPNPTTATAAATSHENTAARWAFQRR